jgi:hydroxymethylbilane synthase
MNKLIIATRGSKLALWQSNHIKSLIENMHGVEVELKVIKTTGDKILDTPLALIGGKGLFTKELEEEMLKGNAHIAVHSLKDVPTKFPEGLVLAAVTKREDARDCFLSFKYKNINELPKGSVVGTTSLRRRMQLIAKRPDLAIKDLRGNIDTRINKLENGEFDAIILATAGIKRLGLIDLVKNTAPIEKNIMVPAMGQAALGIEAVDDEEVKKLIAFLNDEESMIETRVERDFVDALEGGCQAPIGINAELFGSKILVRCSIGMPDATEIWQERMEFDREEYETAGTKFAQILIEKGVKELLVRACTLGVAILSHDLPAQK